MEFCARPNCISHVFWQLFTQCVGEALVPRRERSQSAAENREAVCRGPARGCSQALRLSREAESPPMALSTSDRSGGLSARSENNPIRYNKILKLYKAVLTVLRGGRSRGAPRDSPRPPKAPRAARVPQHSVSCCLAGAPPWEPAHCAPQARRAQQGRVETHACGQRAAASEPKHELLGKTGRR